MRRVLAALVAAAAVTGCKGGPPETFTPSPGDPGKPARPRTFTIRAEPRTERVVPGLQALEQFFVRAGAGVDERER